MNKFVISSLFLSIAISGFSQDEYPKLTLIDDDTLVIITPNQLKGVNATFLELDKQLLLNTSLNEEITLYQQKLSNEQNVIMNLDIQLDRCTLIEEEKQLQVEALTTQVVQKDKKIKFLRKTRTLFTGAGTLLGIFGTYYVMKGSQ